MKPTIVLVHGAWHGPALFAPLTTRLESAGYTVRSPQLPSVCDIDGPVTPDSKADIETIQAILSEEANVKGNDIVVVAHSYGGIPATESCRGFLQKERQGQGQKGGVVALCYLCALVANPGEAIWDVAGMPEDAYKQHLDAAGQGPTKEHIPHLPGSHFFQDLAQDVADQATSTLRYQSKGVFMYKATYDAFRHVPVTYLQCELDQAVTPPTQEKICRYEGTGHWKVEKFASGHSPWLRFPDETAMVIRKAAGEEGL